MPPRNQPRTGRAVRRRRIAVAAGVLAVLTTAGLGTAAWANSHGSSAPRSVTTADVVGRPAPTGRLHLLAFLATQPDIADTASRSQAVQVVSLLTQYGARGLTAEIVDETGADGNALVNTVYDWQLGDVRLAADPNRELAERYAVTTVPAILLVDGSGTVVQRWDHGVLTSEAAQVIAGRLG